MANDKGKAQIPPSPFVQHSATNILQQHGAISTPFLLETPGLGINLHKGEREFKVSEVVHMDDGSLVVKKSKVTLVLLFFLLPNFSGGGCGGVAPPAAMN